MTQIETVQTDIARSPPTMIKQHLYRHFDADGKLLYVGVSTSALRRLAEHEAVSHWFDSISSVKIEHFQTRSEVLAAEKKAINDEAPAHNLLRYNGEGVTPRLRRVAEETSDNLLHRVVTVGFIYTVKNAGDLLGLGLTAMKRIVDRGDIGTITVEGKVRITGWQLVEYVENLQNGARE